MQPVDSRELLFVIKRYNGVMTPVLKEMRLLLIIRGPVMMHL